MNNGVCNQGSCEALVLPAITLHPWNGHVVFVTWTSGINGADCEPCLQLGSCARGLACSGRHALFSFIVQYNAFQIDLNTLHWAIGLFPGD